MITRSNHARSPASKTSVLQQGHAKRRFSQISFNRFRQKCCHNGSECEKLNLNLNNMTKIKREHFNNVPSLVILRNIL